MFPVAASVCEKQAQMDLDVDERGIPASRTLYNVIEA
jgi:hypothetical protein